MATFTSNSPADTEELGRRLAAGVEPGAVLALQGDLGAGKTRLVKGFVAGLGSDHSVSSPTFTIIHEYAGGRMPIYHFDFFRVEDRSAATNLGLDEYLFGEGVCIIEWADRFPDLIPINARWIRFEIISENTREVTAT